VRARAGIQCIEQSELLDSLREPSTALLFIREHLYRRHALPIHCARCYRAFNSESELKQHHRALQSCEIRDEAPPEGFGKEQEKLLKSMERTQLDQGEEGKWKVCRILFPDEDKSLMPSPLSV
jgi:hypothetical protein